MNDSYLGDVEFVSTLAEAFDLRIPYLAVGAAHTHSDVVADELPVFSVNAEGIGQANPDTEIAISEHIEHAARRAAAIYRAALQGLAKTNARLRESSMEPRGCTIELQQHTSIDKGGHVQTFIKVKVTRRT